MAWGTKGRKRRLDLWLLALLLLTAGARLADQFAFVGVDRIASGVAADAAEYLSIAYAIAAWEGYGSPGIDAATALEEGRWPEIESVRASRWRPPLWPLALAVFLLLGGGSAAGLFAAKLLVDLGAVWLFHRLLGALGVRALVRVGAGVLLALHPVLFLYGRTLLSEPFSLLVQLGFVVAWLAAWQTPRRRALAAAGALGGCVALAHPFFLAMPPLVMLGSALLDRQLGAVELRRRLLPAVAAFLVPVLGWSFANMAVYRARTPFLTTSMGNVVAMGWNHGFLASYRNTTAEVVLQPDPGPAPEAVRELSEPRRSAYLLSTAIDFVLDEPRLVPAIVARKLAGAITPLLETRRAGLLERGRELFQVVTFVPVLLVMLGALGRRDPRGRMIVAATLVAYLLMAVVAYPSVRFRAPVIWAELLALALAADALWHRRSRSAERIG